MERLRKPVLDDVPAMKALIEESANEGRMLSRTLIELCEGLRDFQVYEDDAGLGGCCALHVEMLYLAEIRSLVVRPDLRGLGVGVRLLNACIEEATALGVRRVYALTRVPEFFQKCGFHAVDMRDLPHKVFRDCVRCPLFPDCDETAMVIDVAPTPNDGE